MSITGIKESTDELVREIPAAEKFIDGQRQQITDAVMQTTTNVMECIADGLSQLLRLGYSVDGATVTVAPSSKLTITVTAEIPEFTATVSMPLKSEK